MASVPEAPKPSTSTTLLSILVLLPALLGAYGSYKASTRDTDAGYKALVTSVLALQHEVTELHGSVASLTERNALLTDKVDLQGQQLDKLLSDLTVPAYRDGGVEPLKLPALPPLPQHVYEPKPPPASLQEAVDAKL